MCVVCVQLCEEEQMAGWGTEEGELGRIWEGQISRGGEMGVVKGLLTCAPLVHEACNCK